MIDVPCFGGTSVMAICAAKKEYLSKPVLGILTNVIRVKQSRQFAGMKDLNSNIQERDVDYGIEDLRSSLV